jgi:DNA repair exonuclease SbcCD ATPase subunit
MGNNSNQNGWNEYSRLVLAEIETLNNKVDAIVKENNAIKQELSKLEQFKDEITSLKDWKGNVDEVSSPTQLKELQKEVSDLKTFKTMSTTVWVVVQIIFGIAATLFGLYLKSN